LLTAYETVKNTDAGVLLDDLLVAEDLAAAAVNSQVGR
jgi:hypothetical protein